MPKSRAGANAASSKPRRAAAAARKKHPTPALTVSGSFPIIAIGASAGGLEALQTFLKHVPEQSGLAFVVVQHLSPSHKGFLVELLQRSTPMPVLQVSDGMPVRPDHVFLIPPNKDMTIADGVLHLQPQTSVSGLRLPIDFFFRSLAADQQERCVGVLLSGMGSDGTLGMAAIKEKLGATFVQSPAKFDGMPRSAVDAGVADVAAPADELPDKIIAYIRHTPPNRGEEPAIEETAERALEKIYVLLRNQTGSDFSSYKKNTIYRRIERRMGLHQITSISNYVSYLRENPRETDLLLKELLIGVTTFFRDPAAWQVLANDVLPQLLRERQGALRAWVPGCSTGEEAYSLAIVFKEAAEQLSPPRNVRLQIFATDLDKDAIEKARLGLYPPNIAVDVSPERLARFFHKTDYGFRIGKEIREMVMFAPQNLVMDPPFTKLDLLTCRNLLIYLSAEVQKRLMPLFHYSLNPDGILFLGSAET
ncbi:MAG TPA: chemotaxis protein CheB, partial [Terriglobales bacterium]|nr:chemotaxis protein CheB [Terriglobales bacterium]